jgi:predicted AlkP superfamily phosphohydrolase/phosphomutase
VTEPARLMVLGYDAMDPTTVRSLVEDGELPTFRRLLSTAAVARIDNPYGVFVGNTWTSFFSGWSAARTGYHSTDEITPGTYTHRKTPFNRMRGTPFWRELDHSGRRVAAVDVPHSVANQPTGDGVEVSEWGVHDRHKGPRSFATPDCGDLLDRFGYHPVFGVEPDLARDFSPDDYVHRDGDLRTHAEEAALLADFETGAALKTALSTHVLSSARWDLFISVAGESHAVGHQHWYLHDRDHPRHDAALARSIGDPVAAVYSRLDRSLAAHLKLAGKDTLVLVMLSHGMGPHYDGSAVLTEVLRRLDALRSGIGGPFDGRPPRLYASEGDRRRQRFFRMPNNDHIGGVRLNVRGREPDGRVDADQVAADMEWLRAELLDLVNVDTGAPAVRAVERSEDHHPRTPDDAFPDLFVEWNCEAPITTVSSASIGVVHLEAAGWRSGDHRPHGLLLATGAHLGRSALMPPVAMLDLAPTIRAALGMEGGDVDGSPIPWLSAPLSAS